MSDTCETLWKLHQRRHNQLLVVVCGRSLGLNCWPHFELLQQLGSFNLTLPNLREGVPLQFFWILFKLQLRTVCIWLVSYVNIWRVNKIVTWLVNIHYRACDIFVTSLWVIRIRRASGQIWISSTSRRRGRGRWKWHRWNKSPVLLHWWWSVRHKY